MEKWTEREIVVYKKNKRPLFYKQSSAEKLDCFVHSIQLHFSEEKWS